MSGPSTHASRMDALRTFVADAGWGAARLTPLAGDASDRRYYRLFLAGRSAVLMDAPPGQGDDPKDFLRIARHLAAIGLSPPAILAEAPDQGLLLLEDLGDDLFARLIDADPSREEPLYLAATDVLIRIHDHPAPAEIPNLTAADWAAAALFATDWYRRAITGDTAGRDDLRAALTAAMVAHADGPRVLILRDYHAENLLWLPDRPSPACVGLLDFQLGQMGQPGYDLVSMLQDARRDVSTVTERATIRHFLDRTGRGEAAFAPAYATLGAQRALRILGIFARLCLISGKDRYVDFLPRVWTQLMRNLENPALAALRRVVQDHLPEPTPERIERIKARCGTNPTP